jgi:uncharacterized protein YbaP (TraB family)
MIKYALIFALSIGTFSVSAQLVDKNHQLLWEISGNGLEKNSYLYGSFHTNDRRVFNFADSVYIALNQSDAVALELDVFSYFDDERWDTRYGSVDMQYDKNGEPFTSSRATTNTAYGDEDGMPQFLDAYFEQYCHNADKQFFPLETIEDQMNVLSGMGYPYSRRPRLSALMMTRDNFIDVYLKGDIYKLDELMRTSLGTDGYKELITDRNKMMTTKIDSIIKSGTTLYTAVGAGHLAGSQGIINLLRNKGYTMRKVLATYSDEISIARLEVKSKRFYLYENDSIGVTIEFPGKPQEIVGDEESWEDYKLKLIYRELGQGNTYSAEFYERNDDSSFEELADTYIASPSESPYQKIRLSNDGEAFQGLSDSYPEGLSWTRLILGEDYIIVLKAYGGNKFMNSGRAMNFFEKVWFN